MLVLSSLCRLMILGVIMISNSVRWLESPLTPNRKPNPGMLEAGRQIISASENNLEINLKFDNEYIKSDESTSIMVGDREVDMHAAYNFGVKGIRCDPEIGISGVISEILGD